ncbi:Trans-O-hydroxybenzylidenepyruvate hydratase-aldolase [bacterium HR10]|nr:Trans-O-hydroxybenzylidenepyruvate hydratase-aldolase [bacterium HR10]
MSRPRLTADDIRGVYALVPACATPDANSWRATDTVDTDALARLIDKLITDGVHGILLTGSVGESHTLLWEEHQKLIQTAVEVVNRRVPVFVGTTSLNTRETIRKTRYAVEVGADGVMNGTPMYLPLAPADIVQYYRDLAEAVPQAAIMIYHNPHAFRVTLTPALWRELVKIPNVIAAKQGSTDLFNLIPSIRAAGDRVSILVLDHLMYPGMLLGAKGGWSSDVCMGPWPSLRLYEECRHGNWEEAARIAGEMQRGFAEMGLTMEEFQQYQTYWFKLGVDLAGYGKAGPVRPPFVHVPKHIDEATRRYVQNWLSLVEKYRPRQAS